MNRNAGYLSSLVSELRKNATETEWVEFKVGNYNPDEIGANISALSNSAALCGKTNAYLVWGIANDTHEPVGTLFAPEKEKKGQRGFRELA
jgi:ATP-dependent DNA helicase RecG